MYLYMCVAASAVVWNVIGSHYAVSIEMNVTIYNDQGLITRILETGSKILSIAYIHVKHTTPERHAMQQ